MDPDPLKSSPLMNRIHKRNADELRRNSISPGRRSVTENSNKPRVNVERPTTSRKVPNPNPDVYCDYVVQSPPSQRNKNSREELILDYDSKTSESYDDINKKIDEAGANDLSILTSYLQKLANRVDSIETKLTENKENQDSIKRKRAASPYAFYTPETKTNDTESEDNNNYSSEEEEEEKENDINNDEAGEESESGGSNGEESSSAEAVSDDDENNNNINNNNNNDDEKYPSPSDEDSDNDVPIENKSPYRSTKEIYKDYEKVQQLFQSLNNILPSLTPEQKKDTISRMEELIKISDSLKQEHTLSSAWEERNTPVHQRIVSSTANQNKDNDDREDNDDEEEEVEEYNPENNNYQKQLHLQQQQQQRYREDEEMRREKEEDRRIQQSQSSPTKMRSAAEISNDIKQVHMLFAALKESLTICKASDWSNRIMSIFSERFEELGNELRNAEQYYKDHPMTPEKKRSSLTSSSSSQQQQQQQQQQQSKSNNNKRFMTPTIRIPPPKPKEDDENIPLSCPAKTRNQNIKPTYDPLQRFKDYNNDDNNDDDEDDIKNERHSFSQWNLEKQRLQQQQQQQYNYDNEPPRPHSEPNLDEIDENLDSDSDNNNSNNNNNDSNNYYDLPPPSSSSSSSQQQQQPPKSSLLSSASDDLAKYKNYSNEEQALSMEIETLQQEFIQLQNDLENAKTPEERQKMVYRLMDLEDRFKKLNKKMQTLTENVSGKRQRTENQIKNDIQLCFAEFRQLKDELQYASPERKNEIVRRLMQIKIEMDELSNELEELSNTDVFSAPSIQPSTLKQQAQQQKQLRNNNRQQPQSQSHPPLTSSNVLERMQYIKDEFSKCKEELKSASPEEAKKIMERISELNDEAEEITRSLNERSNENIRIQAQQDARSMTYDELQALIDSNDKKINVLISKIQNSDENDNNNRNNDDIDEYTNLVEYNKALQECLNDRNDSNKATPSSTTANSEEDDEDELRDLYSRFLLLQKKISTAKPEDLPKYKQELVNIQKDMEKLQMSKESQLSRQQQQQPSRHTAEDDNDDDNEGESGDNTIQNMIYKAVLLARDCNTNEEKEGFLRQYFDENLSGAGLSDAMIKKFVDTAMEISKLQ